MNRALGLALALLAGAAAAQPVTTTDFTIDVASDLRRRGLSWSDGRAAASATLVVPVTSGVSGGIAATTLRGSRRHAGAEAVIDADLRAMVDRGAWRLTAGGIWHMFAGGSGPLDYGELTAGGGVLIGPLQADLSARYAPPQAAIGGDLLYVSLDGSAALPGTPWTIAAGIGRAIGESRPVTSSATRLRPDGDYTDWRIGIEHVRGRIGVGVTYSDTSIPRRAANGPFGDRHAGARLAAQARLFL